MGLRGALRGGRAREIALDERIGQLPLRLRDRDAVLLERDRAGLRGAEVLPRTRELAEHLGEGLDGLRNGLSPETDRPQAHEHSAYRRSVEQVKTGRKLCKSPSATV